MTEAQQLKPFFEPRSVAVVGVSQNENRFGSRAILYLRERGFKGEVYPVNPKYDTLFGLKCYARFADLPEPADLLVVAVPASACLQTVKEAAEAGIRHMVVWTSGFAEVSEEGEALQHELVRYAENNGLYILGPNSMGLVNNRTGMTATFASFVKSEETFPFGRVGFVSQSGAFAISLIVNSVPRGVGYSMFVSTGNEGQLEITDFINYLLADPETKAVTGYIEGIRNGKKFLQTLDRAAEFRKPLVLIKVGKSPQGAKAALSHTAAIAGEDKIINAVLKQKGVIRGHTIDDLIDYSLIFSNGRLPKGDRVGIFSMSGGVGILLTDECHELGLKVPLFSEEMQRRLYQYLPGYAAVRNPVDVTGVVSTDDGIFQPSVQALLEGEEIDVLVIFLMQMQPFAERYVNELIELARHTDKLIAVSWIGLSDHEQKRLIDNGIPAFYDPSRCIRAVAALNRHRQFLQKRQSERPLLPLIKPERSEQLGQRISTCQVHSFETAALGEFAVRDLLSAYHLPFTRGGVARSEEEARVLAESIGFPLVLKIESPHITHRTDVGGVRMGIGSTQELSAAYREMIRCVKSRVPDAEITGVSLQEMASEGVEVIVSIKRDPVLGPILMMGMGGVMTEVYRDVAFRVFPISDLDIEEMLEEIAGASLLKAFRGQREKDTAALKDFLGSLGALADELPPEVKELEFNPVRVLEKGKGIRILDALMTVEGKKYR